MSKVWNYFILILSVCEIVAACGGGGGGTDSTVQAAPFFIGSDGTNGYELWKTDGTTAGTVMVKDIYPGTGDGMYKFAL